MKDAISFLMVGFWPCLVVIAFSSCSHENCLHLHVAGPEGIETVTYCSKYVVCESKKDETGILTSCKLKHEEERGQ